ncbi:hypothetical protein M9H77_36320 [Catharanthus roseus]|uniref:Uncharacterized protein n=1 Tax=Catharanthus roseus TaxID=4058 RepID=A0ACB9ZRU9_CATRO|nr:hypothetical protein M9H77_36320 [Catharanthus roseus]
MTVAAETASLCVKLLKGDPHSDKLVWHFARDGQFSVNRPTTSTWLVCGEGKANGHLRQRQGTCGSFMPPLILLKMNLSRRFDIDYVLCPMCIAERESNAYLLISCDFAVEKWDTVGLRKSAFVE